MGEADPGAPQQEEERLQPPSTQNLSITAPLPLVSKLAAGKEDDLLHTLQLPNSPQEHMNKQQQWTNSKWDQPTGRGGDPPGLDLALGSSQDIQVECSKSTDNVTDDRFPPMKLEELSWVESMDCKQQPH